MVEYEKKEVNAMSKIGENILTARKRAGLTQEELAARMGYKSKSTINKIELGINDIPQSKIVKFAEVLGTSPAYLMGWVSESESRKNDQLAKLIVKMRTDSDFFETVSSLANLKDSKEKQYRNIKGLISAFEE